MKYVIWFIAFSILVGVTHVMAYFTHGSVDSVAAWAALGIALSAHLDIDRHSRKKSSCCKKVYDDSDNPFRQDNFPTPKGE